MAIDTGSAIATGEIVQPAIWPTAEAARQFGHHFLFPRAQDRRAAIAGRRRFRALGDLRKERCFDRVAAAVPDVAREITDERREFGLLVEGQRYALPRRLADRALEMGHRRLGLPCQVGTSRQQKMRPYHVRPCADRLRTVQRVGRPGARDQWSTPGKPHDQRKGDVLIRPPADPVLPPDAKRELAGQLFGERRRRFRGAGDQVPLKPLRLDDGGQAQETTGFGECLAVSDHQVHRGNIAGQPRRPKPPLQARGIDFDPAVVIADVAECLVQIGNGPGKRPAGPQFDHREKRFRYRFQAAVGAEILLGHRLRAFQISRRAPQFSLVRAGDTRVQKAVVQPQHRVRRAHRTHRLPRRRLRVVEVSQAQRRDGADAFENALGQAIRIRQALAGMSNTPQQGKVDAIVFVDAQQKVDVQNVALAIVQRAPVFHRRLVIGSDQIERRPCFAQPAHLHAGIGFGDQQPGVGQALRQRDQVEQLIELAQSAEQDQPPAASLFDERRAPRIVTRQAGVSHGFLQQAAAFERFRRPKMECSDAGRPALAQLRLKIFGEQVMIAEPGSVPVQRRHQRLQLFELLHDVPAVVPLTGRIGDLDAEPF
ncbi:hypothetical protein [Sphingomonas sp.]|uniref:hypothetical protein n=1 Tax=Sphingomonas sp. TaxID=28214 RepID=UPI0039C93D53